jgi:hypothetical protein
VFLLHRVGHGQRFAGDDNFSRRGRRIFRIKLTVPVMPLALPLMDSSGASSLKTALLTPLGSLKSKDCGAA